jgi:benzil reductase ((S)-benzoin forming)
VRVILIGASGVLGTALHDTFNELAIEVISVGRNPNSSNEFYYCDLKKLDIIDDSLQKIPSVNENDIVIVNSGVIGPISKAADVNIDDFSEALKVNAISNLPIFQSLYKRGARKYIVISSGAAQKNYSGWFGYCISKSLQYGIWESISHDYSDVRIKLLAPGVLNSNMHSFADTVSVEEFPELEKFVQIKEDNAYQDPYESAKKISVLINSIDFFESTFEYLDLREL